jgi:hypothetical protein
MNINVPIAVFHRPGDPYDNSPCVRRDWIAFALVPLPMFMIAEPTWVPRVAATTREEAVQALRAVIADWAKRTGADLSMLSIEV